MINEIDSSISLLIQSIDDATKQINTNKDVVEKLVVYGSEIKENFSNMDNSVQNSVSIADESQNSMQNIQGKIISIVEKIQFMAALSFENGEFSNDVDDISEEIKVINLEISMNLELFTTHAHDTSRVYTKKDR